MTLDQRIARLEITNRRYRLLLTAVSLALIAAVCISAVQIDTVPDVIQTRKLEIVDDLQRVLVTLQGGPQGSGVVETFDETGDLVVALSGVQVGNEHHGMVTTYNGNGQELVAVGSGRGGTGVITTFNRNGRKLVRMDANKTGEGMVTTYDRRGRALAALGAAQNDKVDRIIRARGFEVVDDQNRTLVRLRYSAQGSGEVATFDQNGRLWVFLTPRADGLLEAHVYGRDGIIAEVVRWPPGVSLRRGFLAEDFALGVIRDSLDVQRVVRLKWRR